MRQLVLLSAGLDSVVNLYLARQRGEVVLALTFDYGQRSARRETQRAGDLCAHLEVPHRSLDISWLGQWTDSAITGSRISLPVHAASEWWNGKVDFQAAADAVWVPNRNGVFVSIGAAAAEALGSDTLVAGFNAEEAETFPDNSRDFVDASNRALAYSTRGRVCLVSYTQEWDKDRIFREGKRLGVAWKYLWSCYNDAELMCGECESCARLLRAADRAEAGDELEGLFVGE
jgi:7-cyano-7-deazaguanine synthase